MKIWAIRTGGPHSVQQQPVVGLSFMADDNTLLAIKIIFIINDQCCPSTILVFSSVDFHHFLFSLTENLARSEIEYYQE